MKKLPPLDQASRVLLSREGGVAYLPGRKNSCSIELGDCSKEERQRISTALRSVVPVAQPEEETGHGDQRYYVVLITFAREAAVEDVQFRVAEQRAPDELLTLWREGTGRR
jgi:hypothetical protein